MNKQWKVLDLLNWSTTYLQKYDIEDPQLEAQVLISQSLGITRLQVYLNFEKPLTEQELASYKEVIKKRVAHIPYQYIFNKAVFFNYELYVDENVLIPRPETELLVTEAIKIVEREKPLDIVDVGSGSGCISVALADKYPELRIFSIEKYKAAADITKRNIEKYNLKNVTIINEDIESVKLSSIISARVLVVSNPPYIPHKELELLSQEVKKEPVPALDGGETGVYFYDKILNSCKDLPNDIFLCFEIGYNIKQSVESQLLNFGVTGINFFNDYNGICRIVTGEKTEEKSINKG